MSRRRKQNRERERAARERMKHALDGSQSESNSPAPAVMLADASASETSPSAAPEVERASIVADGATNAGVAAAAEQSKPASESKAPAATAESESSAAASATTDATAASANAVGAADSGASAAPTTDSTVNAATAVGPALDAAHAEHRATAWGFASRALRAAKKFLATDLTAITVSTPEPLTQSSDDSASAHTATAAVASSETAQPKSEFRPALSSHSSVLAVPELLGLLATLNKSGSFSVWNESEALRIVLRRGIVVSAQVLSNSPRLLLGTILVEHGAITQEALDQFVASRAPSNTRLGDALLEAGLIDRAMLDSAVQFQAQRVFHAAYDLPDAWYRFESEPDGEALGRGLSVTHLLLESARLRDETQQRLEHVLGDPFDD